MTREILRFQLFLAFLYIENRYFCEEELKNYNIEAFRNAQQNLEQTVNTMSFDK